MGKADYSQHSGLDCRAKYGRVAPADREMQDREAAAAAPGLEKALGQQAVRDLVCDRDVHSWLVPVGQSHRTPRDLQACWSRKADGFWVSCVRVYTSRLNRQADAVMDWQDAIPQDLMMHARHSS